MAAQGPALERVQNEMSKRERHKIANVSGECQDATNSPEAGIF